MNTQTQEALKMAQEVLNLYCEQLNSKFANDALKAIDEALAQPAQEPVYFLSNDMGWLKVSKEIYEKAPNYDYDKFIFYTHPAPTKQWVGLSDEDRNDIKGRICQVDDAGSYIDPDIAMLEAERILKEKNDKV